MLSLRFGRGPACLLLLAALGCRTGADAPPASCPEPQVIVAPAVDPEPVAAQGEAPAVDAAPELVEAAARLADAVAREPVRDRAWRRLAALVDRFGHRLSGSEALERTIDWCLDEMRADGLTAVRREEVWVPHWVRGEESARLVRPIARPLKLLGLGGTVGTGRRPLRGEVAVVGSLDELTARGEALRDKIVLINQVMPAYDEAQRETFYGHTVPIRTRGAAVAAQLGARAVLIRSVTAKSLSTPHTGAVRYDDGVKKIPAAALTIEDAEAITRMAARGPVEVELELGAKLLPDAKSGNAIGELRGREKPEELVVLACHIDSWDVGEGAQDDGSGCVMAMEAARMLVELGLVPRRTIRVVLYTNEENGLRGAKAYHAAHQHEAHVAAIEADAGCGAPWGLGITGVEEDVAELIALAPLFAPLGAEHLHAGGGGADIGPLMRDGVMGVGLHPDVSRYFDIHHTNADTIEKIDPAHLQRNAAAMALMAYILAERELAPARTPPTQESDH